MRTVITLVLAAMLVSLAGSWRLAVAGEGNMSSVVAGNTAFGLDLYAKLRQTPGNQFFSPLSISTALAMTYGGARGETETQMAKVLHFLPEQEELHAAFAQLQDGLRTNNKKGSDYQFLVANRLWGQSGFRFLESYLKLTERSYGAPLAQLDFIGQPDPSRATINRWVEEQTAEKIRELLLPRMITSDTRLVLTNAVYFLGNWTSSFDDKATQDAPFHLDGTRTLQTPTMHQKAHFRFGSADGVQILEMPYKGQRLTMVVILPEARDGLAAVEASLSAEKLDRWLSLLTNQEVNVFLPRFKVTSQFSVVDALKSLGMTLPFSNRADFSGMDGRQDLLISEVVHKAFVDVNERGTEAAAATAVVMSRKAAVHGLPQVFRADHPFLFLIRDSKTGSILFFGRLADPKE